MRFFGYLSPSGVHWASVCSIRPPCQPGLGLEGRETSMGAKKGLEAYAWLCCVAAVL
jgi:hypothetical protein